MSKKVYTKKQFTVSQLVVRLVLSVISYVLGILCIATFEADIGLKVVGMLLLCGLPYMIGRNSRKMERYIDRHSKGSEGTVVVVVKKKHKGCLRVILSVILGLALGIVLTPYLIFKYITAIIKLTKSKSDDEDITDEPEASDEKAEAETPASVAPQAEGRRVCSNCGAELAANVNFCPNCGTRYDTSASFTASANNISGVMTVDDFIRSSQITGRLWALRLAAMFSVLIILVVNIAIQLSSEDFSTQITIYYPVIATILCLASIILGIISIKTPVKRKPLRATAVSCTVLCLLSLIMSFVFRFVSDLSQLKPNLLISIPQIIVVAADIVFMAIGMEGKFDYKNELPANKLNASYVMSVIAVVSAILSVVAPIYYA